MPVGIGKIPSILYYYETRKKDIIKIMNSGQLHTLNSTLFAANILYPYQPPHPSHNQKA